MPAHPSTNIDASLIRERVLRGIADNRVAGYHFAGYFLDIRWPLIERERAIVELADGPHLRNAAGGIDPTVLGVFADAAVGTATRLTVAAGARLATVHLHLQFTTAPVRG